MTTGTVETPVAEGFLLAGRPAAKTAAAKTAPAKTAPAKTAAAKTAPDETAPDETAPDESKAAPEAMAARFADDVDRRGRFPAEALDAVADAGLLALLVPQELGGRGGTLGEACESVLVLGRQCASSAMVLAMHHLQVACLARHRCSPELDDVLRRVAERRWLLASATTEAGTGGLLRQSRCAVEVRGDRFVLEKRAPVISYGAHADVVLATARRTPDGPGGDQVLVACVRPDLVLEQLGEWDTLGLRGTCSPGFLLRAGGPLGLILEQPFGEVASATMLPYSHILWSHVWLGIATAAADRAGALVRRQARKDLGTTPPSARRLAELQVVLQQLEHLVRGSRVRYDEADGGHRAERLGDAVALNSLKVGASTLAVDVVTRALGICGMDGYRQGTPYSLGRHLRDVHGAVLMVGNDRILGDNAQLLLLAKERP